MSNSILLIEDDTHISELVKLNLVEAGFNVKIIAEGDKAVEEFLKADYSLVIVDLMLPKLNGKEVIKSIRSKNKITPILITSVKNDIMNKVVGFEIGADDYLAKPFEIPELLARVKALLRRYDKTLQSDAEKEEFIEIGDIKVDLYRHKVFSSGNEIDLSPILFDLLIFLMQRPGKAFSRSQLLTYVWEYTSEGYEHTVDTHINRLRGKIEASPANPKYILTVWGHGYRFAEKSELEK